MVRLKDGPVLTEVVSVDAIDVSERPFGIPEVESDPLRWVSVVTAEITVKHVRELFSRRMERHIIDEISSKIEFSVESGSRFQIHGTKEQIVRLKLQATVFDKSILAELPKAPFRAAAKIIQPAKEIISPSFIRPRRLILDGI